MAYRRIERAAAAALVIAFAGAARADDNLEQAKMLFAAGAAAYEKHDYAGAIRAFEGAQKLAPRAAIVFSIAQAHRHLYENGAGPQELQAAVDGYRDYVRQVPRGHRHDDAARALEELSANAQHPADANAPSVSINSSGTPGARITIDDGAPVDPPFIGTLSAGKHRVVISADGYESAERELSPMPGRMVAIDVPLKEKLAKVTVAAPAGAHVTVDGRPMGDAPLATPLEVAAGVHVLAITENGHDAFLRELDLARGEARHVDATLVTSRQRKIAVAMLVGGAVCLVASGAFLAATVVNQADAQHWLDLQGTRALLPPEVAAYRTARDARINWGIATTATFAGAAALGLTGLLLYAFDSPPSSGAAPREASPSTKPAPHKTEPTEMAVVPVVGPTFAGASAVVRF